MRRNSTAMRTKQWSQKEQQNRTLDLSLFDINSLTTENGMEFAISSLQTRLYTSDGQRVVVDLFSKPHLFEFIFSVADQAVSDLLEAILLRAFPLSADEFSTSVASQALVRLAHFFLPLSHESDAPANLSECFRSVELAPPVLGALVSLKFDSQPTNSEELEEDWEILGVSKVKRQRRAKQTRRRKCVSTVDPSPFQKLGLEVPSTSEEAGNIARMILDDQKGVLQYYLSLLRKPTLSDIIRTRYIPEVIPDIVVNEASIPLCNEKPDLAADITNDYASIAFPMVQPLKAALYFDSAEGFGEWRILISTRAEKDLREARKHGKSFDIIIKKIKDLSQGHFSDDNQKRLAGSDKDIPIFEAKMTRDSRLVYQVDCVAEFDSEVERQVLRIFGIFTHAQLDKRFWDSMGRQLASRGAEYRRRCTYRNKPLVDGDNVYIPASWPPQLEVESTETVKDSLIRSTDLEELHALLVLEKFIPFSQSLLNSILADHDVSHVFAVSVKEREIIDHVSSCYVLGRSGTGKTTTMLFKMFGIEKSGQQLSHCLPKSRQLFVTQSRVLAGRVEEYFKKLMDSLLTSLESPEALAGIACKKQDDGELVDLDDDEDWRNDLPKRFSDLQDEHFPLFLTYDKLCKLVEEDLDLSFARQRLTKEHWRAERRSGTVHYTSSNELTADAESDGENAYSLPGHLSENSKHLSSSLVSYDVFRESYWPHFPQNLTKGLDPALVFSEFMGERSPLLNLQRDIWLNIGGDIGVIKGSESSLICDNNVLDRNTYLNLSQRTQSTFASHREEIYTLFEAYQKQKRVRVDYDIADRTHAILNRIKFGFDVGRRVDFLYVDEAQDNLLVDAQFLRHLCRNANGLFWAGDTAQTISIGSSFRFDDLKAFLHRMEKNRVAVDPAGYLLVQPKSFQLAMNYRSHGGIVNCADSVIELITSFWPNSIDILGKEKGVVDGSKPVFFSGWDQDTVRYEQFLFGETGNSVEFGAQQCILVRNDLVREQLRKEVGEIGLIMTLYESKGLEFNDVLLYNFFEDSSVDVSQWRVVLNAVDWGNKNGIRAPRFDDIRHAGVCIELKFLYVAITRARKHLWIVDRSDKGEPMRVLWTSRDQVENCTPGTDVPKLAVASSPEEWAVSGKLLFQNKRYSQAMHCFERAGLPHEKGVANAYYLREQARKTVRRQNHQNAGRIKLFLAAAEAFMSSAQGSIRQQKTYLRTAGECFASGENDPAAAEAFRDASLFTLAVQHYRKAGMFDDAVDVIHSHKEHIDPEFSDHIIGIARLFYYREKKLDKAVKLFQSHDEALEFMEDYDLDVVRATFLEQIGRKAEAAELHLSEGRPLEAIRLFLGDNESTSTQRALKCLLGGLWEKFSLGTDLNIPNTEREKLLELAARFDKKNLIPEARDELFLFEAIVQGDMSHLLQLSRQFHVIHKNAAATMLALTHYLKNPPRIQVASSQEVSATLEAYYIYAELIRKLAQGSHTCNNPWAQKLLGIQKTEELEFRVVNGSLLHRYITERQVLTIRSNDVGAIVSESLINRSISFTLSDHLFKRVSQLDDVCRKAKAFNAPCLHFTLFGHCSRNDCPRDHMNLQKIDLTWFTLRIKIHLQQILILQACDFALNPRSRIKFRRYWLARLFEASHPPVFQFGNMQQVTTRLIPEVEKASQIVITWIQYIFYTLEPYEKQQRTFLTTVLECADLGLYLQNNKAGDLWRRAKFFALHRPSPLMRSRDSYIVWDLLNCLEVSTPGFISDGMYFLAHLIETKIPIDIGALCNFIDFLCGSIAMIESHRRHGLHNLTLPRSWLLYLLPKLDLSHLVDGRKHMRSIVKLLAGLMDQLYPEAAFRGDHLLFDNRSILHNIERNIFIARICRSMCLLGYNMCYDNLRAEILTAATSLRKLGRTLSPLYREYAHATQWKDLASAVRNSTSGSSMDEMIHLVHERNKLEKIAHLRNVRPVVFQTVTDIPSLLSFDDQAGSSFKLTATAKPFTPKVVDVIHQDHLNNEPTSELGEEDDAVEEQDVEDYQLEQPSDGVDLDNLTTATSTQVLLPTAKEIQATVVIQRSYRAFAARQRSMKSWIRESRKNNFMACYDESKLMDWPHRSYRLLFLGPLPHLLVCLEGMERWVSSAKQKAKKQFKSAQHQELDDVMSRMTTISHLRKKLATLKRALEPKSTFHRSRDLIELQKLTMNAVSLTKQIAPRETEDFQEDLKIAMKGIVQERKAAKAAKPTLNVEDLVDF